MPVGYSKIVAEARSVDKMDTAGILMFKLQDD